MSWLFSKESPCSESEEWRYCTDYFRVVIGKAGKGDSRQSRLILVKSEPAQRSEDDGAFENGTVVVGSLGRTRLN